MHPTMEQFDKSVRNTFTFCGVVIFAISAVITWQSNWLLGTGALLGLSFLLIWKSLNYLSTNPLQKAMPLFRGRAVNGLKNPGWIKIPLRSKLWLDFVIMEGDEFAVRFSPGEVIPGDRTEVVIPTAIYGIIDSENPAQVFHAGGLNEVKEKLEEQVGQVLRRWIVSTDRGPQSLDQARQMGEEATNELLESLLLFDAERIHPEIPTEAFIGFLTKGRPLSPKEEDWKKQFERMPENERISIRAATQERLEQIEKFRTGKIPCHLTTLGISIRRIVIGNIEPAQSTKDQVAKVAKEKFEAEAQNVQAKNVREEVAEVVKMGVEPKEALRIVLIRRKIITEKVDVNRFELSPEILQLLDGVSTEVINALFGRRIIR